MAAATFPTPATTPALLPNGQPNYKYTTDDPANPANPAGGTVASPTLDASGNPIAPTGAATPTDNFSGAVPTNNANGIINSKVNASMYAAAPVPAPTPAPATPTPSPVPAIPAATTPATPASGQPADPTSAISQEQSMIDPNNPYFQAWATAGKEAAANNGFSNGSMQQTGILNSVMQNAAPIATASANNVVAAAQQKNALLLQNSSAAATLFQQFQTAVAAIDQNNTMDAAAKAAAIANQQTIFNGAIAGLKTASPGIPDVSSLLSTDQMNNTPPAAPAAPAKPGILGRVHNGLANIPGSNFGGKANPFNW